MADVLAAYPLQTIYTILGLPSTGGPARRLLLGGVVLSASAALELGHVIPDPFERWLIEKWLHDIRSPEFGETAECEMLRAQWEREG